MKRQYFLFFAVFIFMFWFFQNSQNPEAYVSSYHKRLNELYDAQQKLVMEIENSGLDSEEGKEKIRESIHLARKELKATDFWTRYFEPVAYKKMNGPLPVEWETEAFEKFEAPYKREGAGFTLAENYLEEEKLDKKALLDLVTQSIDASKAYKADSITSQLNDYHHFYLCNRLFLLNLAAIYTTAFECPDTSMVILELSEMIHDVKTIYSTFNQSFPSNALPASYLDLFEKMEKYVSVQPKEFSRFDHYLFIRDYVNILFSQNQELIRQYKVVSKSNIDFSLNKTVTSIFSKNLYQGQNAKGIFHRVKDAEVLSEIDKVGKLLFYDPILSGNNQRSCASCHKPTEYFTDTLASTALQFDHQSPLARNTPSLVNVVSNHLVMMDGKHISLQSQTKAVATNPIEMGGNEAELMKKILSCGEYKNTFSKLLKYTPTEKEVTFEHVASAITTYYAKFSQFSSPFDEAMNQHGQLSPNAIKGFNLFMGKAQCATCHFVPQFNGVKPPYAGSEFEVIGVPSKTNTHLLSEDNGRFEVNPATETMNAFRTGTIRNAKYTKPYMHNGVFETLSEVIDFYDVGGGVGRGLKVDNQTLSSDSLHLSKTEKENLIAFIESLNEKIEFEKAPEKLPMSRVKSLNSRRVGGEY